MWNKTIVSSCCCCKSCPTRQPHGLQHAKPPCLALSPKLCPISYLLSWCCYPTSSSTAAFFSFCLQSFPASESNESAIHVRWPKYQTFSFKISPSNGYSMLISFRVDWLDILAVQGTFKSLLQHYNLKASILWHSAFLMVQLSHPFVHD